MVRRLEPEEYERLPEAFRPNPENSRVGVIEHDGKIIARVFLVAPAHMEQPFIEPEHRGGLMARQLVEWTENEARELGITKLFAYGFSAEIEDYLGRLGYTRQPITVWSKELL